MKKISFSALSFGGINDALQELKRYQEDIQRKSKEILRRVAEIGAAEAQARFGADVNVEVVFSDDFHCAIAASGDVVCFLEFGTGELVDTGAEYAQRVPINVYPGSWSEEHGHTYQSWLNSGAPGSYRYNTEPRRGMYHAYEEMCQRVDEIAKEVFDE